MVTVWATANHLVLGQIKVDDKWNEITAIPKPLHVLDIAFDHDHHRLRMNHGSANFSILRHTALNLLNKTRPSRRNQAQTPESWQGRT